MILSKKRTQILPLHRFSSNSTILFSIFTTLAEFSPILFSIFHNTCRIVLVNILQNNLHTRSSTQFTLYKSSHERIRLYNVALFSRLYILILHLLSPSNWSIIYLIIFLRLKQETKVLLIMHTHITLFYIHKERGRKKLNSQFKSVKIIYLLQAS